MQWRKWPRIAKGLAIQIGRMPKVAPTNLITEEVPITVSQMFAIFAITCIAGHISNVRKNRWQIFRHYTCSFCHIPQVIFSLQC